MEITGIVHEQHLVIYQDEIRRQEIFRNRCTVTQIAGREADAIHRSLTRKDEQRIPVKDRLGSHITVVVMGEGILYPQLLVPIFCFFRKIECVYFVPALIGPAIPPEDIDRTGISVRSHPGLMWL